jgi:radical SAM protein with 4Fe4S-binding SPASM domain
VSNTPNYKTIKHKVGITANKTKIRFMENENSASDFLSMYYGISTDGCAFRTCLGNTVYIKRNGDLSICPYKENDIQLNDIENCSRFQQLFETDSFRMLLKENILRRNTCKSQCSFFKDCRGGCSLNPSIEFSQKCDIASRIEQSEHNADNEMIFTQKLRKLSWMYRI